MPIKRPSTGRGSGSGASSEAEMRERVRRYEKLLASGGNIMHERTPYEGSFAASLASMAASVAGGGEAATGAGQPRTSGGRARGANSGGGGSGVIGKQEPVVVVAKRPTPGPPPAGMTTAPSVGMSTLAGMNVMTSRQGALTLASGMGVPGGTLGGGLVMGSAPGGLAPVSSSSSSSASTSLPSSSSSSSLPMAGESRGMATSAALAAAAAAVASVNSNSNNNNNNSGNSTGGGTSSSAAGAGSSNPSDPSQQGGEQDAATMEPPLKPGSGFIADPYFAGVHVHKVGAESQDDSDSEDSGALALLPAEDGLGYVRVEESNLISLQFDPDFDHDRRDRLRLAKGSNALAYPSNSRKGKPVFYLYAPTVAAMPVINYLVELLHEPDAAECVEVGVCKRIGKSLFWMNKVAGTHFSPYAEVSHKRIAVPPFRLDAREPIRKSGARRRTVFLGLRFRDPKTGAIITAVVGNHSFDLSTRSGINKPEPVISGNGPAMPRGAARLQSASLLVPVRQPNPHRRQQQQQQQSATVAPSPIGSMFPLHHLTGLGANVQAPSPSNNSNNGNSNIGDGSMGGSNNVSMLGYQLGGSQQQQQQQDQKQHPQPPTPSSSSSLLLGGPAQLSQASGSLPLSLTLGNLLGGSSFGPAGGVSGAGRMNGGAAYAPAAATGLAVGKSAEGSGATVATSSAPSTLNPSSSSSSSSASSADSSTSSPSVADDTGEITQASADGSVSMGSAADAATVGFTEDFAALQGAKTPAAGDSSATSLPPALMSQQSNQPPQPQPQPQQPPVTLSYPGADPPSAMPTSMTTTMPASMTTSMPPAMSTAMMSSSTTSSSVPTGASSSSLPTSSSTSSLLSTDDGSMQGASGGPRSKRPRVDPSVLARETLMRIDVPRVPLNKQVPAKLQRLLVDASAAQTVILDARFLGGMHLHFGVPGVGGRTFNVHVGPAATMAGDTVRVIVSGTSAMGRSSARVVVTFDGSSLLCVAPGGVGSVATTVRGDSYAVLSIVFDGTQWCLTGTHPHDAWREHGGLGRVI